jgi:tetratricopeptide (TPR) repeat protein
MRRLLLTALVLLAVIGGLPATASALDAGGRALVDQLVFERAASIVALQHRADDDQTQLMLKLSDRDRALRATLAKTKIARQARAAAAAELTKVTDERRNLTDQIAAKDGQFAAEIGEYRRQIASIAASPDPRKRAALARYAAGDRKGAMVVLEAIQTAETASLAAGWKEVAGDALAQYRRGELSRDDAIAIVGRAAQVSDTDAALWTQLATLLTEAGRADEAVAATRKAAALTP